MAAGQGGMDRTELKKHIQFAREEAVQLAFAIGGDGEAVIHMHRRKPGRALEKELKEASPDSKNHRWGTLSMDPDDPKLARVVVNKAGGGLSRKLGKALKGTGCGKVQIVLEDGTEVDVHEEEDGDVDVSLKPTEELADGPDDGQDQRGDDGDRAAPPGDGLLADDDAPPRGGPGRDLGDIPVSPRMAPPSRPDAPPGTGTLPDMKALTLALSGLVKRLLDAVKHDPSQREELTTLATGAQASLRSGDLDGAAAGMDVLRQALDDVAGGAAPAAGNPGAGKPQPSPPSLAATPAAPPAGIKLPQGAPPAPAGNHGATHPAAPVIAKAKAAWSATRTKIQADLTKLTQQLEAALTDHEMADELAASCKARVDEVLQHLDEALSHKLDEVNKAPDPASRAKLVAEAHQVIARYTGHIGSDPTIKELDENPFVPLALAKTLTTTLTALSRSIT